MPAAGLTSALIKRRTHHGGSATSDAAIAPPTGSSHFTPGSTVAPGVSHVYPSSTTSGTVVATASGASASAAASAAAAKAAAAARARNEAIKSLAHAQKQIKKISEAAKPPKMPKAPKLQTLKAHPQQAVKLAKGLAVTTEKPHTPGSVDRTLLQAQKGLHKYVATVHQLPHAALPKAVQKAQAAPKVKVAKAKPQRAPQRANAAKLDKTKVSKHPQTPAQAPASWSGEHLYNYFAKHPMSSKEAAAYNSRFVKGGKQPSAKKAKPAPKHPYVFPFQKGQYTWSRTDQGTDFSGTGKIGAIGKAKYLGQGQGAAWASGGGGGVGYGVVYKLLKGPKAGKKVFTYEGIDPAGKPLQKGDIIHKGQTIAKFAPQSQAAPGSSGPSIEMGFSDRTGATRASKTTGYTEGQATKAGQHMTDLLHKIESGGAFKSGGTTTGSKKPPSAKEVRTTISSVASKGPQAKALAAASIKYGRKYGIPPSVLFAQQGIESGWGANTGPSSANAQGYTQFIPSTRQMILDKYGVDAYGSPAEAVHAQALLLRDAGAKSDLSGAVYSYNHSSSYVADVLNSSKSYSSLDNASGRVYTLPGPPGTSGATGSTGVSGISTSGTTSMAPSGVSTASSSTSTARSNRARLLAEINRNRKKAANKIGTYRSALSSTSPTPTSSPSAPSTTSSSSGSIKLGL